jgi:hypothetical protein
VNKEFAIFEVEGKPEAYLDFVTKSLIPRSSLKPERVFSGCGLGRTLTKIRSSLNDKNTSDGT